VGMAVVPMATSMTLPCELLTKGESSRTSAANAPCSSSCRVRSRRGEGSWREVSDGATKKPPSSRSRLC